MGLGELTEEEKRLIDMENITIGELKNMFGKEATRRGLEYMASLSTADENFRQSGEENKDKYGNRVVEGQGVDPDKVSEEAKEEASSSWRSSIEETGLGLDHE